MQPFFAFDSLQDGFHLRSTLREDPHRRLSTPLKVTLLVRKAGKRHAEQNRRGPSLQDRVVSAALNVMLSRDKQCHAERSRSTTTYYMIITNFPIWVRPSDSIT